MGFRTAEEVALPAFVASRIAAAPAVKAIFARFESAGLAPPGALEAAYESRTQQAILSLRSGFEDGAPQQDRIEDIVHAGILAADHWWQHLTQEGTSTISSVDEQQQHQ